MTARCDPATLRTCSAQWITAQPPSWRSAVSESSQDPFRRYTTALSTTLPHAVRVLERFHVIELGFTCVHDVRRRVQQKLLVTAAAPETRSRSIRRSFAPGAEHLTEQGWDRMLAGLDPGDRDGQFAAA